MPLICCLAAEASAPAGVLEAVARACSPRVAPHGDDAVIFDAEGLTRVLGAPAKIASDVHALAAARGAQVRVALAGTGIAAWVLAHARPGLTIVAPGGEAAALEAIPIRALAAVTNLLTAGGSSSPRRRVQRPRNFRAAPAPQRTGAERRADGVSCVGVLATFDRWGLRTLGDIAKLSRADLHARFGEVGVRLHQAARGEDAAPLVPVNEAVPFLERLQLEWPIEGLEPLSFVLARLCDALSASLERADRGAIALITRLRLVTRETHERQLHLPAPMREARVLRTLITLDLESHPPGAGIDVVEIEAAAVSPGQIVQGSLLSRALPSAETLSTLVARLRALMGDTRVGAPIVLDTHDDRKTATGTFRVEDGKRRSQKAEDNSGERTGVRQLSLEEKKDSSACLVTVRRFRVPVAARVAVARGVPVAIWPGARGCPGGRVRVAAGPWRSSGCWWTDDRSRWDRDEWDVALVDGTLYRIAQDRASGQWDISGAID